MDADTNILDFVSAASKRLVEGGTDSPDGFTEIAHELDAALEDMVAGLEGIASCQQPEEERVHEDIPEMAGFCAGMERLSRSLFPHLDQLFSDACTKADIDPTRARPVLQSRLEALAGYMLQLTQVHGIIFEEEGGEACGGEPVVNLRMVLKARASKTLKKYMPAESA